MTDLTITDASVLAATTGSSKTGEMLCHETYRLLMSGQQEERNKLVSAISTSDTSLTMTYDLKGLQSGSVFGIDLELFYVWEVNNKVVTVERGWNGSVAAEHAANAIVHVKPKFPYFSIFQALNEELDSLSGEGLFQMKTLNIAWSSAFQGYDLAGVTDILEIYEIRYETPGSNRYWPLLRTSDYSLSRNMDTTEFASGLALLTFVSAAHGQNLRVRYKAPFGGLTSLTDNVSAVTGLHSQAHDILVYGAAARLLAPTEAKRNFTSNQGDPRRSEEVPSGGALRSAAAFKDVRQKRLSDELSRQTRLYPPRF